VLFSGLQLRQHRLEELRSDTAPACPHCRTRHGRISKPRTSFRDACETADGATVGTRAHCAVVAATAFSDFEYDHITAVDRSGVANAGAGSVPNGTLMTDRELLARILDTASFSVGSYGWPGFRQRRDPCRLSVTDDTGAVSAALYAGINLTWLNTADRPVAAREKTVIYITDRKASQIARNPTRAASGQPITRQAQSRFCSRPAAEPAEVREDGVLPSIRNVPSKPHVRRTWRCSLAADQQQIVSRSIDRYG